MQKIQLSIPEPCHENWQNMTPTDQGRFCNSCAKVVVDFSMMTDTEVLNYFSVISHEKVCGRVIPSQLGRDIMMPKEPKKRLFWYWNYIVMFFFMFFSRSNYAKAQTKGEVVTVPVKPESCSLMVGQMVAGVNVKTSDRIITGNVVDEEGKPVPFATIKIKTAKVGLAADVDGAFSMRVNKNDVLVISAGSFKSTSVTIADQKSLRISLVKMEDNGVVVEINMMLGGIRPIYQNRNNDNNQRVKQPDVFVVKDQETGTPLNNVSIILTKFGEEKGLTAFTDKKGTYKLKRLAKKDGYHLRVFTNGYQPYELSISGSAFNVRKEPWEVLLQKKEVVKTETSIRMGAISTLPPSGNTPIYVLDGIIISNINDIDPNNIENITVLQGPAASALFGPEGANGAIVMTSKTKAKILDTIKVSASTRRRNLHGCGTTTTYTIINTPDTVKDNLFGTGLMSKNVNHPLVYPNPVQRGNAFAIDLKINEPGNYLMRISNTAGVIVLDKQLNIVGKVQKEMIQCDSRWATGIYYISIFDKKNQLSNSSSFIVQ